MTTEFRILYREFLFRIIDLELLAPGGDMSRLLAQFIALLLIMSLWVMLPAATVAGGPPSELSLLVTWTMEHFLIATTMLAVGLFAVMSWESMFPDRRDVLVLSPLPVRARTLFLAKVAAVATALTLTVASLNLFPGLAAPFVFPTALTYPPPRYDAALAPLAADRLEAVLDRDLAAARDPQSGAFWLGKEAGIAIGVVKHGVRRVFTYGTARPDSIFEIGSISKTFTGLLLAQMAAQGKVRLDEPVRLLLPPGTAAQPPGDEITLLDLATQHSGLPSMPDNFNPADVRNSYANYHAADLYAYIGRRGVGKRGRPSFFYSNLGLGLLGQALANRARTTYPQLLQDQIAGPLGMPDTVIRLSREHRARFLQGHSGNGDHRPARALELDALAGAGAIRSTAGDMLTWLEAQLHPERFPALAAALHASHPLKADVSARVRIALAWFYEMDSGIYQHNGATPGYTSYAFFHLRGDYAAIVLINTGPNLALGPEQLGQHIRQRLSGEPAVSLARPVVEGAGGFGRALRSFAAYWGASLAAAAFMLCLVATLQGVAQLLPRQTFLRVSSLLQMLLFCLFLTVYFMQPPFAGPDALVANQSLLSWLPSYWFFALFQHLNGPLPELLLPLARRAWIGLALACAGALAAYLICYFRTLRKIAEQPDILRSTHGLHWLPRFGNSVQTAVGQFSIRTLLRSRQHRVILSFYLGIASGLALFVSKAPVLREQRSTDIWYRVNAPLLVASIVLMWAAVIGIRVVFSMPLELQANWILRVMPSLEIPECLAASRRSLYGLSVAPVWVASAALFFSIWPWRAAAAHLAVLWLLGAIAAELCLYGFRKIPFTCSYLPGKSYFHMAILAFLGLMFLLNKGAALERQALDDPRLYTAMIAGLAIAAGLARWRTAMWTRSPESAVRFEEEPVVVIQSLGLYRDGFLPVEYGPCRPTIEG
jgi:CubicO group peptidase (beta-lactamase class C family)